MGPGMMLTPGAMGPGMMGDGELMVATMLLVHDRVDVVLAHGGTDSRREP
jgi:hypothetical protein